MTLGFLPREAASGNGAGISLRRWRPKIQNRSAPQTLGDYQTAECTAMNEKPKFSGYLGRNAFLDLFLLVKYPQAAN